MVPTPKEYLKILSDRSRVKVQWLVTELWEKGTKLHHVRSLFWVNGTEFGGLGVHPVLKIAEHVSARNLLLKIDPLNEERISPIDGIILTTLARNQRKQQKGAARIDAYRARKAQDQGHQELLGAPQVGVEKPVAPIPLQQEGHLVGELSEIEVHKNEEQAAPIPLQEEGHLVGELSEIEVHKNEEPPAPIPLQDEDVVMGELSAIEVHQNENHGPSFELDFTQKGIRMKKHKQKVAKSKKLAKRRTKVVVL